MEILGGIIYYTFTCGIMLMLLFGVLLIMHTTVTTVYPPVKSLSAKTQITIVLSLFFVFFWAYRFIVGV